MSETFGQALRRHRIAAGLSQKQLRRQGHVDQSTLSRYEHGRQRPTPAVAARLDDLLGAGGYLRTLATGTIGADVTGDDGSARISHALQEPHRVDASAVAALADVLAAQRRLDDQLPAAVLLPATTAQADTAVALARQAAGPHRDALAEVAAEWIQFRGWLHAENREDDIALRLLGEAERAADEVGSGVLAAQAANFRGYVARQQGNARGIARWFLAEHNTPDSSLHQQIGAAAQAADGCARLGDADAAHKLLSWAESQLDTVENIPAPHTAYWLDATFHRLNIGLGYLALRCPDVAADHLQAGLAGLPAEQQHAEWTGEYRAAAERACAQR